MFVLGIDPGLSRCGYGVVERASTRGSSSRAVAMGVLKTPPGDPLPARLGQLQLDLMELITHTRPDVVAVERVFFQPNTRFAMSVGQASGLALAAAHHAGCEVVQYTPNEVKQAVAGYGAAPKEQVQRMVQTLLGLAERPRPPDVADALALALTHLANAGMRQRLLGAREAPATSASRAARSAATQSEAIGRAARSAATQSEAIGRAARSAATQSEAIGRAAR